jgi:hypothetical protein
MNPDDCPDCGAGAIARDPRTHACAVCDARRVSDHFRRLNGSFTPEARAIRESQREAIQVAVERAREILHTARTSNIIFSQPFAGFTFNP